MPLTEKTAPIEFIDWGLIEYSQALQQQEKILEEIHASHSRGVVIFCTHPPVITLGRKTQEGDVFSWKGSVIEVSRGGRATYHGPSQLLVYPILNLDHPENHFPAKDIGWYLRHLENGVVETLKKFGVEASGRSQQKKSESEAAADETGVWVGNKKIASLGIGIRKWITFHGAAINLDQDASAFQGMNPCGFKSDVMISLEQLTGHSVNRELFKKSCACNCNNSSCLIEINF